MECINMNCPAAAHEHEVGTPECGWAYDANGEYLLKDVTA